MEPTFVVIGVSYRTASLSVRERFVMNAKRRCEAVEELVQREGIDEVMIFSTCNRTEFYVWTQDASEASNSILRFLTRSFDLKLSEWSNFYRLVDDAALAHVLRVASGLDTHVFGDPDIGRTLKNQWQCVQDCGTTGQFLDALIACAVEVADRVRRDAWAATAVVPVPFATAEQCREVFPDLKDRIVLVLGSGQMAGAVVAGLKQCGVQHLRISSPTAENARRLASESSARALPIDTCAQEVFKADVVICATSSPVPILTAAELDPIMRSRSDRPLLIMDLGVPRNVDSAVRSVPGIFLFDSDDLAENVQHRMQSRPSTAEAEQIIRDEAAGFRLRLQQDGALPAISALRQRLEEICATEMENVSEQYGPFTEDQTGAMQAFAVHITQRISSILARQLRQAQGHPHQDSLTEAIEHLFHLPAQTEPRSKSN